MSFDPSLVRYTEAQSQQFFEQVAERARAVPGVTSRHDDDDRSRCRTTRSAPRRSCRKGFSFRPGRTTSRSSSSSVDEHYFDTMGIALLEGRNFRRRRRPRRAASRHREPAVRAALLAESGSASASAFAWTTTRRRGSRSSGSRRPANTSSSPSRRSDFVYFPYRQKQAAADDHGGPVCRRSVAAWPRRCARSSAVSTRTCRSYNVRTMEELYRMRAISIFNVLVTHRRRAWALMGLGLVDRRPLRPGRVRGEPAHARDRHPHGDRRRPATVLRHDARARGSCWRSIGLVVGLVAQRGRRHGPCAPLFPSGRQRARRSDRAAHQSFPIVLGGHVPRGLSSRAARVTRESGFRRAPVRLIFHRLDSDPLDRNRFPSSPIRCQGIRHGFPARGRDDYTTVSVQFPPMSARHGPHALPEGYCRAERSVQAEPDQRRAHDESLVRPTITVKVDLSIQGSVARPHDCRVHRHRQAVAG